jgi:hypothetical protein
MEGAMLLFAAFRKESEIYTPYFVGEGCVCAFPGDDATAAGAHLDL